MRLFFVRSILPICLLAGLLLFTGCPRSVDPSPENAIETPGKQESNSGETDPGETVSPPRSPLLRPTNVTPREWLAQTAAAYRSAQTYSDHGFVRLIGEMADPEQPVPATWACTVAFQAPNRLRLEINEGILVSDEEDAFAQVRSMPDQVLRFPTPSTWTLPVLFQDLFLDDAMEIGLPDTLLRFPPQLIFLFARDPLKTFLPDNAEAEFLDPQWLDGIPCDLIRVNHPEGNRVLWINRDNRALVRFDYLVEGLPVPPEFKSIRMIRIEINDAAFDRPLAPEAFIMQQPGDARQVPEFQSIESEMLGRRLEQPETLRWKTFLPEGTSEEKREASLSDYSGETLVLCFWAAWSEASPVVLQEIQRLAESFSETEKIRFFAVNIDDAPSPEERGPGDILGEAALIDTLDQILAEWELASFSVPVVRETDSHLTEQLRIVSAPTVIVLAPGGRIEFYYRGIVPQASLKRVVEETLKGETPSVGGLAYFKSRKEEHTKTLRVMGENDVYFVVPESKDSPKGMAVSQARQPETFSLVRAWSHPLAGAGNIALLPPSESYVGLIFVPYEGNFLAVIDDSGKILSRNKPEGFRNDVFLTMVRTGIDEKGNRYVGMTSIGGESVRLFDERLQPLAVLSPRKDGKTAIADFCFVDPEDTGELSILTGSIMLDETGRNAAGDSLHLMTLRGEEIWANDGVSNPFLVDAYSVDGKSGVLSLNVQENRGTLLNFDVKGQRLGTLDIEGDPEVLWFRVLKASESQAPGIVAVLSDSEGRKIRLASLDLSARLQWSTPLPSGEYQNPVNQIVLGDLFGNGIRSILVPTPDGTVMVFDRDGTPVDSFSFGKILTGLAVVSREGKSLLITTDAEGVTAWEIVVHR